MPATLQRIPALKSAPKQDIEQGNLIDKLLAEQKTLQTPVARFSDIHHRRQPDLADHYRSLIPLTKPSTGEQYAFEVSLDRCTGCKACVSACHSLNGLDDHEAWRDTGTLLGGSETPGWQQTVTTACHHCADPGCMNGCPVGAYEKDAETGIVRHLDDQCIGCSYCILKCPYDVPKFSKKRGIVRKCDMCHQRLAEGEAPACVQACPTEAIRIIKVPAQRPRDSTMAEQPSSLLGNYRITQPTTRYIGRSVPESAVAADREMLVPQHAHWPLVLMLMLTQAGAGMLMASHNSPAIAITGAAIFFSGMGASVFHLGQPLKAWRFFLGLRTSWLSREILAFSLFAPIPMALVAFSLLPMVDQVPFLKDYPIPSWISAWFPLALGVTTVSAIAVGLIAVFTSVMIYHDTHRSLWRFPLGAARFFGSVASFAALAHLIHAPSPTAWFALVATVLLKMIPESRVAQLADCEDAAWSPDTHSARLQTGPLGKIFRARFVFAYLALFTAPMNPWVALPLLLIAELLERQVFFQSVQAPKMPGNFGPSSHH
ncbi:MAG: 4Fe-4S dicluster domain-containing protein [Verrucomicrobiota bacterium]